MENLITQTTKNKIEENKNTRGTKNMTELLEKLELR